MMCFIPSGQSPFCVKEINEFYKRRNRKNHSRILRLPKKKQPMLFLKKHDIHERTVTAELKSVLEKRFKEFHVNCEYNRMTDENGIQIPKRIGLDPVPEDPSSVYPDIIVHRQEDGLHNLLIVEVKMNWKNAKKQDDIKKLKLYIQELKYKFGLYLELGEEGISDTQWFN